MNAPAYTRLFQPQHHYSSPSRKAVRRGQGNIPGAVAAPHLPLAAQRVALPVAARPASTPAGVKTPGSVGAPPCLTAARSACARSGSFPLGRRAGAAPALAAVPLAGLPARGKLVRQMPARGRPGGSARGTVRIRGTGRLAGPLRGMRSGSPAVVAARSRTSGPVQDHGISPGPGDSPGGGPVQKRTERPVLC
jgi:hypothetical protein